MTKHIEIKTYEWKEIKVTVEINFDLETISLVERCQKPHLHEPIHNPSCFLLKAKSYVFATRQLQYMDGWRNVLKGIEYAIGEAEKELTDYISERKKKVDQEIEKAMDDIVNYQQELGKDHLLGIFKHLPKKKKRGKIK